MIEEIFFHNELLAIIIRNNFNEMGIHFFTSADSSQQFAFMHHPKGKIIAPHIHNAVSRQIIDTKEVLFIRKGVLKVNFFSFAKEFLESRKLYAGDAIFLSSGGHGFEVLEEVEIYEVKQGPYAGDKDKLKF